MKSVHFHGGDQTTELILRTDTSVNQLSINGGVADLRKEIARDSSGAGQPAANENLESMVMPTEFPTQLFLRLVRKYNKGCCVNTSRNSPNFLNNRN